MRILIFIEKNNGLIFYKTDTFWGESTKINHAKVYPHKDQNQIDDWIIPYGYNIRNIANKHLDKYQSEIYPLCHECKFGYRIVDEQYLINSGYSVVENAILGDLTYTHQLYLDLDGKKQNFVDIRKQLIREEKLKDIL